MSISKKKILFSLESNNGHDIGYINLKEERHKGDSKRQITIDGMSDDAKELPDLGYELVLDIDENNKLIGIEIFGNLAHLFDINNSL